MDGQHRAALHDHNGVVIHTLFDGIGCCMYGIYYCVVAVGHVGELYTAITIPTRFEKVALLQLCFSVLP